MIPQTGKRTQIRADVAMAAAILALGIVLTGTGQHLLLRWQHVDARYDAVGFEEFLGLGSSIAGLCLVGWWVLSFATAVAAVLLRRSGRHNSATFAGRLSPEFMRRLVIVVLGMNLAGVPLANAASIPVDPAWHPTVGTPAAQQEVQSPAGSPKSLPDPQWRPTAPVAEPGLLAPRTHRGAEHPTTQRAAVVVAPGDSLWSIAASHLGPLATDVEVAAAWPLWHEANRSVIGHDPNVLLPGQILQTPSQAVTIAPRT